MVKFQIRAQIQTSIQIRNLFKTKGDLKKYREDMMEKFAESPGMLSDGPGTTLIKRIDEGEILVERG